MFLYHFTSSFILSKLNFCCSYPLRAIFIYLFDLTRSLDDKAQRMFKERGEKNEKDLGNPMQETNLDCLTRCIAALCNLNPESRIKSSSQQNHAMSCLRNLTSSVIRNWSRSSLTQQTDISPQLAHIILGSTGKRFDSRNEQCFATIYRNGPRIIFCLYDFYEYILPTKKFEFFDCFSLFCLINSI